MRCNINRVVQWVVVHLQLNIAEQESEERP